MRLKPLHDKLIVKRDEADEVTEGGLFIPQAARDLPISGTVVAVGPGKLLESGTLIKPSVKTGDKILFGKYSGVKLIYNHTEYLLLRDDEVLVTLEEEEVH